MKKYSLRVELIGWSVAILLLFMAVQLVFVQIMSRNFALSHKEEQIEKVMAELVENYSDDPMEIYEIVDEAQDVENLRIMVFGEDFLIYHSSSVENAPPRHVDFDEFRVVDELNQFKGRNHMEIPSMVHEQLDAHVVSKEVDFEYKGEPRTIMIWSSVNAIDSAVNLFFKVTIAVSIFVILCISLVVTLFSKRFSAQFANIQKVAAAVANLDFSNKAEENVRISEFTCLAQSINIMSDNLEAMIGELNTDRRNLTDKVENHEKLDQMRRQFVANISHEMKTPLSMLMMYSESLKLDLPNMDKNYYYDTIIQEAAGLNAMVEQLLDTSAVENGLSSLNLENLNFSEFVQDFLEKISPFTANHQVETEISPEIFVSGDRKYLEQALRNYVTNAISHTEDGKKIRISLEKRGEEVVFSVFNQGNPVKDEDIPFLWDSFYRADKSRTQVGEKRVGLGLYIVKTCISSHFGQVFVENKEDGVEFSFTLPLSSDEM